MQIEGEKESGTATIVWPDLAAVSELEVYQILKKVLKMELEPSQGYAAICWLVD